MLVERIAAHFPAARVEDQTVSTGVGGLTIECLVDKVRVYGATHAASLFFRLRGGRLGVSPVFASISGYGKSAQEAIVTGACNWACAFGPVLRAALTDEVAAELTALDVTVAGRPHRLFVDGLDRAMQLDEADHGGDGVAAMREARARLGGGDPWLVQRVIASDTLPILASAATVLSVFVGDAPDRIVEVKVNGRDWAPSSRAFDAATAGPPGTHCLLRELAVLVPVDGDVPLRRHALEATLRGIALGNNVQTTAWRGWRRHGGTLGAPLTARQLAKLEREIGPLPDDHRTFVGEVAASGAGPGYGLLSPLGAAQRALAAGTFAWDDEQEAAPDPAGVLALAHAGCGVMWLLVLNGRRRGEVWLDARSSDGRVRPIASSFTDWYGAWLDCAVRDAVPWHHWDETCCSTPNALSKATTELGPLAGKLSAGALSIATIGAAYFEPGAPLDPCHPCALLAADLGLAHDVFTPGVLPRPGRDAVTEDREDGWWRRLTRSWRKPR
jgi:hypothetical protein